MRWRWLADLAAAVLVAALIVFTFYALVYWV